MLSQYQHCKAGSSVAREELLLWDQEDVNMEVRLSCACFSDAVSMNHAAGCSCCWGSISAAAVADAVGAVALGRGDARADLPVGLGRVRAAVQRLWELLQK